jgi:chaperone required for assembly of F1-ATPase
MKRFYKTAEVAPAPQASGYVIRLDGKQLATPGKAALVLPTPALAEAIAEEWASQGEELKPAAMPLMRLAATATDRVAAARSEVIEELMRYAGTDLLCYRAEEPEPLVARQAVVWQPLLDWALARFGAELTTVCGLMPQPQPDAALAALRRPLQHLDAMQLTALLVATAAAGSLVIGLALLEGRLSAEEAFAASELDETYQIELWGEDAEATARRAALKEDLLAVERFLKLRAK